MKTILAALDFSAGTQAVVSAAADLARATGSRLLLLHVAPEADVLLPAQLAGAAMRGHQPGEEMSEPGLMSEEQRIGAARLQNLAWSLKGFDLKTTLAVGDPAAEIARVAREQSADVIVMGMPRHNPIYELILGSALQGLMKNAPCQILLAPTG